MIFKKSFLLKLIDNWLVKILSLTVAVVLAVLYRINTLDVRFFTVPLTILVNENYIATDSSVDKVRVRLRGSEEDIYTVLEEDITVYIDLISRTSEGEFQAPVLVKKTGSALSSNNWEIIVDPINVQTHLEEKLTRSLPVQPQLNGFPLDGYNLDKYFIAPSAVTVTGPKSQIEGRQFIPTEEIDLVGRFEDFSVLSRLVYPSEDISYLGGHVIEFTGMISEVITVRTISDLDIFGIDLADNLLINGILPKAAIKVQGTQKRLERIQNQNLQFTIDYSNISKPGRYSLPVQLDIPDELTVLTYTPSSIDFEVLWSSESP